MKKQFTFFDHQADIGIKGYGSTLEEAFGNSAKALFSLMYDLRTVRRIIKTKIGVEAHDIEALFVEWLNELLAQSDIKRLVFSRFTVDSISKEDKFSLTASVVGETINLEHHRPKVEVKAATYEQLSVGEKDGIFFAQTVVDV